MASDFYGIGQVAERVGLTRSKLIYLVERGELPGASYEIPGRRLFSEDDIQRIAKSLNERKRTDPNQANEG